MPQDKLITFIDRTPRAPSTSTMTDPCPTCNGDKVRAAVKGNDVEHQCEQGHTWLLKGKA